MFNMMKVFNCQDMPPDVRKAYFEVERDCVSNDCYLNFGIDDYCLEDMSPEYILVRNWLIANGASPVADPSEERGEDVLIKHWW